MIGGAVGYRLLRRISSGGETGHCEGSAYDSRSKLEALFGPQIWSALVGKVVVDFGCGPGTVSIELAQRGANRVIGLDNREKVLEEARRAAERAGVADRCSFATETDQRADVVLSVDAFEHFEDPVGVLSIMRGLIEADGCLLIAFGPPWYHPLGGHLFSVFPWAHLIFTEGALLRWRSDFKSDGATRFREVEGGLNQMTVGRFRRLIAETGFQSTHFESVPIRKLRPFANRATREFTTAVVRCRLVPAPRR
jgi:SAM-dependent methyltransferase